MKSSCFALLWTYVFLRVEAQLSSFGNSTGNSTLTTQSPAVTRVISLVAAQPHQSFSFVIPAKNTQECNIYGPLCQTGSITVGVDLTSITTTTTLPCSSYLTAQSSYLNLANPFPCEIKPFFPDVWKSGFGRSPECTSYAAVYRNQGNYTFSNCGTNDAVVPASAGVCVPPQIPPGVLRQIPFQVYECCGNCTLDVAEVRLYYFPDETINTSCHANMTLESRTNSSATLSENRANSILGSSSIAILSGYTFTSPSVYLEIVGTAAVTDSCAPVGAILTNPIVALPPGALSTYSPQFPFTVGEEYHDPNGIIGGLFVGHAKPLNIAELACPSFGVGQATRSDGSVYITYGPPYLPIIIPPPQVLSLDPDWQKYCTGYVSYSPGLRSFAIFDPPRILTPVAALLPPATSLPSPVEARKTPTPDQTAMPAAQPAQATSPSIPKPTAGRLVVSDLPVVEIETAPSENSKPLPSRDSDISKPQAAPPAARPVATPPEPGSSLNDDSSPTPPSPSTGQGRDPEPKPQNLGALIFSAFGGAGAPSAKIPGAASAVILPLSGAPDVHVDGQRVVPLDPSEVAIDGTTYSAGGAAVTLPDGVLSVIQPTEAGNVGNPPSSRPFSPQIFTVAGQTFAADPSTLVIAGTTLLPGGPGITLSGTPISLAPSGALFIDSSPIRIPNSPVNNPTSVFTVGDQTFTANPNGFAIGNTKILPGGARVSISGTPISLAPDGAIVIGKSTIPLPAQTPAPNVLIVGGQVFTANPTGFTVAGTALLPGDAPVVISGTPISLASAGAVIIGDSTLQLPAQTPAPYVLTAGGQVFTPNPKGFIIAGSTLLPGDAPIVVSGTSFSLGSAGKLVIGSSTINIPIQTPATNVITVGGLVLTAEQSGIVLDKTTLLPGGPGAIISGMPVSLETGGNSGILLIGTSKFHLPAQTFTPDVFTAEGLVITAESSAVVVDGETLVPDGSAATISGTPIRLQAEGSSGAALIIGSSTIHLPAPTNSPNVFTVGGLTFTAEASTAIIDGTTLVPGGPGAIISGTPVSLNVGGSLFVGSTTIPLNTGASKGSATAQPFEGSGIKSSHPLCLWGILGAAVGVIWSNWGV